MHSRSGGANRISSTLYLPSFGQAGKPRCQPLNLGNLYSTPGMGLRYQSGEERHSKHSSALKKKTKCAFLAITMETILPLPFRPKYRKWREVTFSITHPFRSPPFFLPPWPQTEISLVASIPKDSFYKNNRWQFWIEGRGHLGKDRPCYVGERGNAEEVTA